MSAPLPLRLVLDTNSVMALWSFEDPALEALRRFVERGAARLLVSAATTEEFRRVLAYRQFGLTAQRQATLLADYIGRAETVAPKPDAAPLPACRDHDDQKFLELARDGAATHLLSRDKALLKLNRHRLVRPLFIIQTPENFIAAHLADESTGN